MTYIPPFFNHNGLDPWFRDPVDSDNDSDTVSEDLDNVDDLEEDSVEEQEATPSEVMLHINPELRATIKLKLGFLNRNPNASIEDKLEKLKLRCSNRRVALQENVFLSVDNQQCYINIPDPKNPQKLLKVGIFTIGSTENINEPIAEIDYVIPSKRASITGQEVLNTILTVCHELGVKSCSLNDAAAIHSPQNGAKWSLRLWHVFATGKGWYESRGFKAETAAGQYRRACSELYRMKISDLAHVIREVHPSYMRDFDSVRKYYCPLSKKKIKVIHEDSRRVKEIFQAAKRNFPKLATDAEAREMYHKLNSCALLFPDETVTERQNNKHTRFYNYSRSSVSKASANANRKDYSAETRRFIENYKVVSDAIYCNAKV